MPESIAYRRFQTELVLVFHRVHHQIQRRSTQLLEAAGISNITPAGAVALIVLFNARRPIKAHELAVELDVSDVTVSRLLKKLEEDGWIERTPDPADGRAMFIRLTSAARASLPPLREVSNAMLDAVFSSISYEESAQLAGMVQRIYQALTTAEEPAKTSATG